MENNNSLETEFAQYSHLINLIDKFEKGTQGTDMQDEITRAIRALTTAIDLSSKIFNISDILKDTDLLSAIGELKLALANPL